MQQPDPVIERRTEDWIEVPGEGLSGVMSHLELRPGASDDKVRVKAGSVYDTEVTIASLREGLDQIEEEHRR